MSPGAARSSVTPHHPILPPLSLLSLPYSFSPFLLPSPSPPPLRSRPHIAANGSGEVLKLPQRVQAEPSRRTLSDAFSAF